MTDEKRKEITTNTSKIAHKLISCYTTNDYKFSLSGNDIKNTFEYYEILKTEVKKKISITDFNQDRHKIAATTIVSLLVYKPIQVDQQPQDMQQEEATVWINQTLAIAVAEYIIFSFLELQVKKFNFPKTTTQNKEYYDYLMALINSITNDITLGTGGIETKLANYITSLSHILYLLEKYTLECK